jgi:type IV secretion system protein VirD4
MHTPDFNEQYRFGSASWADERQMRDAGLFGTEGLPIGFHRGRLLRLPGDAPMITIGGAGTGKLRDIIGHVFGALGQHSMIVLDPRGEIAATFMPALAHAGIEGFLWNPYGLHGLPQHRCNPLDPINPVAPTFHADCKLKARSLVSVTSRAEGKYFEQRACAWTEALIKRIAEASGSVSLPALMSVVNLIESGDRGWADFVEGMTQSAFDDVRRTAGEMLTKQQDSPREFGSIMGEIYASLSALDDPTLNASLGNSEFSLSSLCNQGSPKIVFLMLPAEYLHQCGAVLRMFFTAAQLYKSRAPGSRRLVMLIDEAAQLGAFPALQQLYTYGRGIGIRPWTFWQDIGQIINNFGPTGVATFMGSSQMRQFFGVREYPTAQLISNMLGTETLEYDDARLQEAARLQKRQAVQRVLAGDDMLTAMMDAAHYAKAAQTRTKQARKLHTEDEILSLDGDRQILFVAGNEPLCIKAEKQAYYARPEMAGLYLPNPHHPPYDSVPIAARGGTRSTRVIRETVPHKFLSYAQYRDGSWAYVEGYKPT